MIIILCGGGDGLRGRGASVGCRAHRRARRSRRGPRFGASLACTGVDRATEQRLTRALADADRLLVELNRIGNNLNQITARMHLTGELSFSMAATLAELRGAMAKVAAYDP